MNWAALALPCDWNAEWDAGWRAQITQECLALSVHIVGQAARG